MTTVRLFPGMVVVRENIRGHYGRSSIIVPDTVMADERSRRWHRGKVIAMGPPARLDGGTGPEVPQGFRAGDEILFHFEKHEKARTRPWPPDGEPAVWLMQQEIDAVLEAGDG